MISLKPYVDKCISTQGAGQYTGKKDSTIKNLCASDLRRSKKSYKAYLADMDYKDCQSEFGKDIEKVNACFGKKQDISYMRSLKVK